MATLMLPVGDVLFFDVFYLQWSIDESLCLKYTCRPLYGAAGGVGALCTCLPCLCLTWKQGQELVVKWTMDQLSLVLLLWRLRLDIGHPESCPTAALSLDLHSQLVSGSERLIHLMILQLYLAPLEEAR
jgi:hypothetical protein